MTAYNYAAALITVTDMETTVLRHIYENWKELRFDKDNQTYYEATFERNGKSYKVVTAQQNEMGMTAGAVLSMKLIEHFRPRYLTMPGIAAGVALGIWRSRFTAMLWRQILSGTIHPENL